MSLPGPIEPFIDLIEMLFQVHSLLLDHRHLTVVSQDALAGEFCISDLADELLIASLQPFSRMIFGTDMVAAAPPREPATCLPVRLPTSALLLFLALSIYSGFALNLRTGFWKMIWRGLCFLRRLRPVYSGFTNISSKWIFCTIYK